MKRFRWVVLTALLIMVLFTLIVRAEDDPASIAYVETNDGSVYRVKFHDGFRPMEETDERQRIEVATIREEMDTDSVYADVIGLLNTLNKTVGDVETYIGTLEAKRAEIDARIIADGGAANSSFDPDDMTVIDEGITAIKLRLKNLGES